MWPAYCQATRGVYKLSFPDNTCSPVLRHPHTLASAPLLSRYACNADPAVTNGCAAKPQHWDATPSDIKKELLHVPLQVSHRDSHQEFYVACFTLTTRLQGTNAHAILAPPELASQPDKQIASPAWRRKRYWHLPSAHSVMVSLISAAESRIQLAGSLRTPALTFLLDHQVTNCSLSMVDHRLDAYCGDGIDAAVAAFKQVQ